MWLKLHFPESDVAGERAIGQVTKKGRKNLAIDTRAIGQLYSTGRDKLGIQVGGE
jgi:hypothetical protein